jgi:hypothetical protein
MKTNRFWLLLIGAIFILSLAALLIFPHFQRAGDLVYIYLDGSRTPAYRLLLDEDRTLRIPEEGGRYNLVVIEGGTVRIAEASCPDQTCVRHSPISTTGVSIVCLPHRLVVEVHASGGQPDELDAVTQ